MLQILQPYLLLNRLQRYSDKVYLRLIDAVKKVKEFAHDQAH